MSWSWIAVAVVLPLALAMGIAWPFWGRARDSLGSAIGAGLIFVFAIAFVAREYVQVQEFTNRCLASEAACVVYPEPFTRFGVYGFIAMAQTFVLFAVGAAVERRKDNRTFAAEWRR